MNFPSQCLLLRLSHSNCPTVSTSLSAQPRREPRPKQMPCEKYDRGSTSGASRATSRAPASFCETRGGGGGRKGKEANRRVDVAALNGRSPPREEIKTKQNLVPPSLSPPSRTGSFHFTRHEKEKKTSSDARR